MAWSQATLVTNFDAEAGDIATLASTAQKTLWFNEGMHRLGMFRPRVSATLTWSAGDTSEALPSDFAQIERLVYDSAVVPQEWVVFDLALRIHDPDGASSDGTATLYYWAYFPDVSGSQDSLLSPEQDIACLYYSLYRFYRRLASNRNYYKRYATMVGANAVQVQDLQAEADRYYQDYLDSRGDQVPKPPVGFYRG